MQYSTLCVILACMATMAYFLGRRKAVASVGGMGSIRKLHSLPGYYGYYAIVNQMRTAVQESDELPQARFDPESRAARAGAVAERSGMRRAREAWHHAGLGPEPGCQLDVGVTATTGSRQTCC